jgi:hypothetical protein
MDIGAIKALEIPAAPDAALFLWATVPILPKALDVMSALGIRIQKPLRLGEGQSRHRLLE